MAEKGDSEITAEKCATPSSSGGGVEKRSISKWCLGVTFYAGLVTAALIAVCVFAALNGRDKDRFQLWPKVSDTRHYRMSFENEVDDLYIDVNRDHDVIYRRHNNGSQRIIVLDFGNGLGGVSDTHAQECYMTRDMKGLPRAAELTEHLETEVDEIDYRKWSVDYSIERDDPVTDLGVVPSELQTSCWGKSVYWLQRIDEVGRREGSRVKRGLGTAIAIRVGLGVAKEVFD